MSVLMKKSRIKKEKKDRILSETKSQSPIQETFYALLEISGTNGKLKTKKDTIQSKKQEHVEMKIKTTNEMHCQI